MTEWLRCLSLNWMSFCYSFIFLSLIKSEVCEADPWSVSLMYEISEADLWGLWIWFQVGGLIFEVSEADLLRSARLISAQYSWSKLNQANLWGHWGKAQLVNTDLWGLCSWYQVCKADISWWDQSTRSARQIYDYLDWYFRSVRLIFDACEAGLRLARQI